MKNIKFLALALIMCTFTSCLIIDYKYKEVLKLHNDSGIDIKVDITAYHPGNNCSVEIKDGENFIFSEEISIKEYTVTYATGEHFTYTEEAMYQPGTHSFIDYKENPNCICEGGKRTIVFSFTFTSDDYIYAKTMNAQGIYTDMPINEENRQ